MQLASLGHDWRREGRWFTPLQATRHGEERALRADARRFAALIDSEDPVQPG